MPPSTKVESQPAAQIEVEEDDKSIVESSVSPDILEALERHLDGPTDKVIPTAGSPEWTDYILSKFAKNELVQGYPTCAGLRRIFDEYYTVIASNMEVLQCPDPTNGGRATVKCTIVYYPRGVDRRSDDIRTSDVADCFYGNTEKPYCDHPVATAATLAEGRALRKALRLNVVTSEEVSKVDPIVAQGATEQIATATMMSSNQKTLILNVCKKLGIAPDRALSHLVDNKKVKTSSKVLDELNYEEAQSVIRAVQNLGKDQKKGGEIIPETLFLTPEEKKNK